LPAFRLRSKAPRVAVDANPATRAVQTGTEVYTREVVRRLAAAGPDLEWVFYGSLPVDVEGVELTVLPARRLWSQLRLPVELARRPPDLFFAPAHVVPFLARGRALTVVHDLAFERFPAAYRRRDRSYLRLTTRWAARRCALLLTVSESTRADLAELYGVDPARVRVAYPGITPPPPPPAAAERAARLARIGVATPFALHVGRVEAKKNQLAALAAVERIRGLRLVCAGPIADRALGDRLRRSDRAVLLGRVAPADLEVLYRSAAALVFPSVYEGFGLPLLEAMARGLPVVTAATSSLAEVGAGAALYAAGPGDVDGLVEALRRVLDDAACRSRLVAAGRRRAAEFTWERTAQGVVEAIREALNA
jgi:glycosyltransferase involved in cell wall biosynthesis